MLRVALITALLLAQLGTALAQDCGWRQTRFGMTEDEFIRSAAELSFVETSKIKPRSLASGKLYSRTTLASAPYEVFASFTANGKFESLMFVAENDPKMPKVISFSKAAKRLAAKHGPPSLTLNTQDEKSKYLQWSNGCTVIELEFREASKPEYDILILRYSMLEDQDF